MSTNAVLTLAQDAGSLLLTWPADAGLFTLHSATNLAPPRDLDARDQPRRSHQQPVARDFARRDERPALLPSAIAVSMFMLCKRARPRRGWKNSGPARSGSRRSAVGTGGQTVWARGVHAPSPSAGVL